VQRKIVGGAVMIEKRSKNFILLAILGAAFIYRFFLLTMNTYPPGADIGLHESVIKSITTGKTSFLWNYYQMGGGLSATNPGYHIFAAFVISMTGLPDYLAQALVASFFSAFLVLISFLIVKQIWNEYAAFIVAFLITFSLSDILMLNWGGYPNIIALMLIPVVFYLFLRVPKISSKSYLAAASILVSALFLTHIFSAIVFVAITIFALLICALFSKRTGLSKKQAISWLIPIAFGILLVSPYIVNVIPVYFSSEGTITGTVSEISQAVLQTRLIPLEIICLSLIPAFLFFLISKYQNGKFLNIPAVLFASWILVPALATQSYLLGVYVDYTRFLYFLAFPIITFVGIVIANSPNALSYLAKMLGKFIRLKIKAKPTLKLSKKFSTAVVILILMVIALSTPLFALPYTGVSEAKYFQVMNPPGYQAIQWVKANTPVGSVCVADAEFGWWLSGFAQRPTLSAVDPQYLILQHEVGPANVATNLLAADYKMDNGLIQIEQAGAYANANTHEILAILNNTTLHPTVFSLNDTQISILFRENGSPQQLSLSEFNDTYTNVESYPDNASFIVTRVSQFFNVTEEITLFKGVSFAEISFIFQNNTDAVNFDWLHLPFRSIGFPVQHSNSIAVVDNIMHWLIQIVFPEEKLGSDVIMQQNPASYELINNLQGNSTSKIRFFVGLCQFNPDTEANQANYYNNLIENNTKNYLDMTSDLPLNCFDYQAAIREWNISYIIIRDFDSLKRFNGDPTFSLVFKNTQVSIFKVIKP
jgi:hypothetical protein